MRLSALALALALGASALSAQEPASPFLPSDHWAVAALKRLDALGLGGAALDPGSGSITRAEAQRRLAAAVALARGSAGLERLAAGYADRFREELGERRGGGARLLRGAADGGYRSTRGELLAGYDRDGVVFAPTAVAAAAGPVAEATVAAAVGQRFAALAAPRLDHEVLTADALYATATAGALRAWAGRRPVVFGAEARGSAVLAGGGPFDGAGLSLDSVRPLRALGPVRLEVMGARLHATGALTDPWFGAARIWLRPTARLWLAANRAAVLGGHGNTPLHAEDIGRFILGIGSGAHGETENQVASLEVRWRPPLALPLVAYGEWAFDDLGNSYVHVPGVIAGLELPAVPALPELALGLERTSFAGHCCGNPPWYRHSALPWIERRVPLGHPLGGEGSEWLAYGRLDLDGARVRLSGDAFRRDRGPENLFAPVRQGRSTGGDLSIEVTPVESVELFATGSAEAGRGWRESEARTGVRVRY